MTMPKKPHLPTRIKPGDMEAFARVVRHLHVRGELHFLFQLITAVLDPEPYQVKLPTLLKIHITVRGKPEKCSVLTEKGWVGIKPGSILVIDNQTEGSVCFDPGDAGHFDEADLEMLPGVEVKADGTICVPPGISKLPISDDAPHGLIELHFACQGVPGGPKLIIPPPPEADS